MGSQVSYLTVPKDLAPFQSFAEARNWVLLPFRDDSPPPQPIRDWATCLRGVLVRVQDRDQLSWKQAKSGSWWADYHHAPAVEYGAGHLGDGSPRRRHAPGRMWFATAYLRDMQRVPADPEFVKAAKALLQWPRRHWRSVGGVYESPGAFVLTER